MRAARWFGLVVVLASAASGAVAGVGVPVAVTLDDPLYDREDHWVGGIGLSWLYRVDPEVDAVRRWTWDAAQEHGLAVRLGGEAEREAFDLDRDLAIRRVAEGTWVVTATEPWPANSLLAEMPDGTLLLADTPTTGAATRSLLEWAEARFGERPLLVVNTHAHPDAVGGNRVAAEAGAVVYGSVATARLVEATRAAVGRTLAEELARRPALASEFAPYEPLPPGRTFRLEDGLRLMIGGEPVEVRFPGAAHTPDNVVVWLPERQVLFGGCLVRAGGSLGNVVEADLGSWPGAVRVLEELGAEVVVPGHGDRTDPGLLAHTRALLARISHRGSSRGGRGAVRCGDCGLRSAEAYSAVRRDPRPGRRPGRAHGSGSAERAAWAGALRRPQAPQIAVHRPP